MELSQIVSLGIFLLGSGVAAVKAWSVLHERQKQHWQMLQAQGDLITKLFERLDSMPKNDCTKYMSKTECAAQHGEISLLVSKVESIARSTEKIEQNMKEQEKEHNLDKIKYGSLFTKIETLLNERTIKAFRE